MYKLSTKFKGLYESI
jgi:hypothetical protein